MPTGGVWTRARNAAAPCGITCDRAVDVILRVPGIKPLEIRWLSEGAELHRTGAPIFVFRSAKWIFGDKRPFPIGICLPLQLIRRTGGAHQQHHQN
jgi:hypothetical protein